MALNSYEYDYEPKRYISLVKTADTCIPNVLLSAASTVNYPTLPASLQSLAAPILFFTRKNPETPYTVTATDNRAKLKASETKLGMLTVGDVVRRLQQLLRSEECSRAVISEVKQVGPSTVALHFNDMTGAVLAAYILGSTNAASAFDGLFTIDRAFDPTVFADLLALRGDELCLKEGGHDDSMQRVAFGSHADDDFFDGRGGARPLFLAMPKADATSSRSNAPPPAPPGLEIDPSIVAALRDEWKSILGEDSNDGGADDGARADEVSGDDVNRPPGVETHPDMPISEDNGNGLEATPNEVMSAGEEPPRAPPQVYRRLQLAPRTLPPPLPLMPPRPERPTIDLPGDARTISSKQRPPKPQKCLRSKPGAGNVKPENSFQMLVSDDDDDDKDEKMHNDEDEQGDKDGIHRVVSSDGNEAVLVADSETDEDWQLAAALQASESEADQLSSKAQSSPSSPSSWVCGACTLVNADLDAECKVCGAPRPDDSTWQTA